MHMQDSIEELCINLFTLLRINEDTINYLDFALCVSGEIVTVFI